MASRVPFGVEELDGLTDLSRELARRATLRGAYLFWRAQVRRISRAIVKSGNVEEVSTSTTSGQGLQVVAFDGRTALASRDDFAGEPAAALLASTIDAAEGAGALGVGPGALVPLTPTVGRAVPDGITAFESIDLAAATARLCELEREIAAEAPGVTLTLSFQTDLDAWRIVRTDGGDVTFAMPRCALRMTASSSGEARHTVGASVASPSPRLLDDPSTIATFLRRARSAALLAAELPDAPLHPAGSFPLVIDYALAKGLAHEAFGHASEADGFRSSVLARAGRFREGETVGASHVSIVDEPVPRDHAWQPFSATGVARERVTIVDRGRLREPLTDPWSAHAAGARLTGADRAESFRSAPLPRMTNIRIEVDDPLPAPGDFEDYGPREVRELLRNAGVLRRHPRVVFLSGYSGGQVNPATGDFVFNCKAIYVLSEKGAVLHKPAIFSGSMFGALKAIREAFGPLRLDALGTCGKWGQNVPSSGGSHYFLALDPNDAVRLGGR
ncbi:MAG TPA: TldD/PmbA family protein [Candidatus Polarisedimenticolaceae bacterium]|nr:TldD/PmbA family protein [Candidatus Polarisedimenticolaceae bacterium]